jgi:uncharacterized membrane protein
MRSWGRTDDIMAQTLIWSGLNWSWFAIGGLALVLLLLVWSLRTSPAGPLAWVSAILKFLGFTALAACLLEPLSSGLRARPGANLFAIVADNSQSLQISDRGSERTRAQQLADLLNPQHSHWQSTLEENFDVRRYSFDSRLQASKDFADLSFDGRSSALGSSLRALVERYQGRPLAGVLLLTDGNATDIHGSPDLAGLPPIYPVVLGNTQPIKDIAIQQVHATQTAFEDAPVSVQADVVANGYSGEPVSARVVDSSGKTVLEQTLTPRKPNDLLPFRFQLKPDQPGLSFYHLRVRSKIEAGRTSSNGSSGEATLLNNDAIFLAERGQGPYRILYVSGRPNWEFKFLNRALDEDPQVQLVGLVRVARREPKFNFLGRAGESSNPLFRGFGEQSAEEVERYDQPVLVRLNTRDEFELRGGFPKTAEELYSYQAVVIDHLEADFFTPDQQALLQKFVSERGGGFLMLGGMESFQEGNYQNTPIGDMLPVYLGPVEEGNPPGPWRLDLTREGWLQSWARVRDNEADEKARLEAMAPFQVLNRVRELKPGASAIATVSSPDGLTYPALAVQRFGRGHSAALMLGDFWHWGFHDADAHRDMDKAWRQLMRWLVNDVPRRVELAAEPQANEPNGAVQLQIRVRDPKYQPLDDVSIDLEVQPALAGDNATTASSVSNSAPSVRLHAEPSPNEPGLFLASYVPRLTGGYRATVAVTNSSGAEVGHATAGWTTDLVADEFRSLTPNISLLETIAQKSGGEIIPADRLESFARNLPHRHAPIMEPWTHPLWHTPVVFAFALACFLSEWGLRRWKGLP